MSDFHRGTRRFDDVEAASFSPDDTGLTVTEDGGDWVAKDDAGNVVLRYDEAVGDWVTDSLKTDVITTAPTGTICTLNGDQSIPNDTITDIAWETETTRGTVSGLLDSTNNVVVVPSGFDFAKVEVSYSFGGGDTVDFVRVLLNGSAFAKEGIGQFSSADSTAIKVGKISTAWFPVSKNDEIGADFRHNEGTSTDLQDVNATYMNVRLL